MKANRLRQFPYVFGPSGSGIIRPDPDPSPSKQVRKTLISIIL